MLSEETKENLRQAYHWVTSLSEDSLLWLAELRNEVHSPAGDSTMANSTWVQLVAYCDLYKTTCGTEHAQFLLDYSEGRP